MHLCEHDILTSFYVYGLFRPDKKEGLFYIGKGCRDRMYDHRKEANRLLGSTKGLSLKIKTIHYLWRNGLDFVEKILWSNLTEEDAFAIEEELISEHGRLELGYGSLVNMTNGGDGVYGRTPWNKGIPRTEEVKEKIRKANIGKKYSDEVNKKKGRKGLPGSMKGKKHSEETKRKISEGCKGHRCPNKGIPVTEEVKRKISEKLKGRKISDSVIAFRKEYMKGNKFNLGKKHSEETRRKMSESQKGKVMSIESRKKMSLAKKGKFIPWNKNMKLCEKKVS